MKCWNEVTQLTPISHLKLTKCLGWNKNYFVAEKLISQMATLHFLQKLECYSVRMWKLNFSYNRNQIWSFGWKQNCSSARTVSSTHKFVRNIIEYKVFDTRGRYNSILHHRWREQLKIWCRSRNHHITNIMV